MATEPRFSISIDINAPAGRVYEVMADIDRWHEWTPSITSIRRLDGAAFEVGKRAMIKQPKFPPAMWTLSRIEPGRRFEWFNKAPGVKVTGHHSVEPTPTGSRATLALSYEGLFGSLLARMTEGITRRYIAMEAAGLKARAENPVYRHTGAS
jgi:hypothetical protein